MRTRVPVMRTLVTMFGLCLSPYLVATADDLRLVGTVTVSEQSAGASRAMFETGTGDQLAVESGHVVEGCILTEVATKSITMRCAEGPVTVYLREDLEVQRNAPVADAPLVQAFRVQRDDLLETLADRQRLVGQITLEPAVRDGYLTGFRVADIAEDSDLNHLGLQDDDVILSLNGVPASDPGTFMQAVNNMRGQHSFDLLIERDGQQLTYAYNMH